MNDCSALVAGKCTNGFPVNPGCSPMQRRDGSWSKIQPICTNEVLSARLFPEHGGPRKHHQSELAR